MSSSSLKRQQAQRAMAQFSSRWVAYRAKKKQKLSVVQETFSLIRDYEQLSAHLYWSRAELLPQDPLRQRLEDFMATISGDLLGMQASPLHGFGRWLHRYRQIWRQNFSLFLFTTFVFIIGLFIGWHVVAQDPQAAAAFIPQNMMETVIRKQRWFDNIHLSPIGSFIQIAVNNIRVCLLVFVFGAMLGIGGLFLLLSNALLFGALMAFCYVHSFHDELTNFVLGHGPLELSIVVASAFSSFIIGRVFFMRPYKLFRLRFRQACSDSFCLVTGICPWLILAAAIEAFVSPHAGIPRWIRILVGVSAAVLFWGWSLWSSRQAPALSLQGAGEA